MLPSPFSMAVSLCSVGIGYTLQVVAQRQANPAHAAILLSLKAAVGGWWLLDDVFFSARGLTGCGLMLGGMLFSQLYPLLQKTDRILIDSISFVYSPELTECCLHASVVLGQNVEVLRSILLCLPMALLLV